MERFSERLFTGVCGVKKAEEKLNIEDEFYLMLVFEVQMPFNQSKNRINSFGESLMVFCSDFRH